MASFTQGNKGASAQDIRTPVEDEKYLKQKCRVNTFKNPFQTGMDDSIEDIKPKQSKAVSIEIKGMKSQDHKKQKLSNFLTN